MGGACDAELQGETSEELMENGKKHVHEAVESGDEAHKEVVTKMEALSEEEHNKWAEDFKTQFDSLEDVA